MLHTSSASASSCELRDSRDASDFRVFTLTISASILALASERMTPRLWCGWSTDTDSSSYKSASQPSQNMHTTCRDNTFALPTEVFSSCLAIVSAVTVGVLFLWPALRYGTGYQTVWETRPSAETPSDVHWKGFYFQLTCVHSTLELSGRCTLQIYLLTYLLTYLHHYTVATREVLDTRLRFAGHPAVFDIQFWFRFRRQATTRLTGYFTYLLLWVAVAMFDCNLSDFHCIFLNTISTRIVCGDLSLCACKVTLNYLHIIHCRNTVTENLWNEL